MLRKKSLLLTIYGILLASAVTGALKGGRSKLKIATTTTTTTTTELPDSDDDENSEIEDSTLASEVNVTTKRTLTGIPQIDYIWDPNLPRELNGYNLSEYPFYVSIPPDIEFNCDGLHDGFYASVPHKCQVYHHCLFGTRYDFLCANFTAFDQKTFICHFASEVDCANSKKYWHRNDALYQAASTSTPATTTTSSTTPRVTTTTAAATTTPASVNQATLASHPSGDPQRPYRRRRPLRRRPAYDYYEDEYYDDEYEPPRVRGGGYDRRDNYDYDDRSYMKRERDRDRGRDRDRDFHDRERDRSHRDHRDPPPRREQDRDRSAARNNRKELVAPARPIEDPRSSQLEPSGRNEKGNDYEDEAPPEVLIKPAAPSSSVYARPRAPPKIRRPVPLTEQDRFAYKTASASDARKVSSQSHVPPPVAADDYVDDKFEETPARRPMRQRRPFRDHERNHYDQMRPQRERERDQHFRSRYKEDPKDDVRSPKVQSDRWRDQQYEHGNYQEESLDYKYDNEPAIPTSATTRDKETSTDKVQDNKEKEKENVNEQLLLVDCDNPVEAVDTNSSQVVDRSSSKLRGTNRASEQKCYDNNNTHNNNNNYNNNDNESNRRGNKSPSDERNGKNVSANYANEKTTLRETTTQSWRVRESGGDEGAALDDGDEYDTNVDYDKSQRGTQSTLPPFRAGVRVVKRPFLPSRGGHSSPRGLYLVGVRAMQNQLLQLSHLPPAVHREEEEEAEEQRKRLESPPTTVDNKQVNEAHKIRTTSPLETARVELPEKRLEPSKHRAPGFTPALQLNERQTTSGFSPALPPSQDKNDQRHLLQPVLLWNHPGDSQPPTGKQRTANDVYRIQDIPESEYDVSLNEALTPPFHHDSSLPTGFLPPIHHKTKQEPARESSDNTHNMYHDDKREQKPFAPSLQIPLTRIGNNQESRRIQFGGLSRGETQFVPANRPTWNGYN